MRSAPAGLVRDQVGMRREPVESGPVARIRCGAGHWRTRVTEPDDL